MPEKDEALRLGKEAEEDWQQLQRQLELAERYWVGFIFTFSTVVADTFRERVEKALQARVKQMLILRPQTPEELRQALFEIFSPQAKSVGYVWLEALIPDAAASGETPWLEAWGHVVSKLNETRDRLRRHLGGFFVLVARPELKPLVRSGAPDLWSVRELVLEPPPPPPRRVIELVRAPEAEQPAIEKRAIPKEIDSALRQGTLLERLRTAEGLLATDRPEEAVALALEILDEVEAGAAPQIEVATILWLLARAEKAAGDVAAAADHIGQAIALDRKNPERHLEWLDFAGELANDRADLEAARQIYDDALVICRSQIAEMGESPERWLDLSIILDRVGDAARERGDPAAAESSYVESLEIRRRLVARFGESPERLRGILVSLDRVGGAADAHGDFAAAEVLYLERLDTARRLVARFGGSSERLRDLAASLSKLGNAVHARGDFAAAEVLSVESLEIARRLVARFGESPERLRDLAVSLNNVGNAAIARGDFAVAETSYNESLETARRLVARFGESPERLRDLAVCLSKLGEVARNRKDLEGARSFFSEALSLTERLLATYGERPLWLADQLEYRGELAKLDSG